MDERRTAQVPVDAAVTGSSDALARQDATLDGPVGLQFVKDDHTSLVANRGGVAAALAPSSNVSFIRKRPRRHREP